VHRPPRSFDLGRSRWWLDGLRQAVTWLRSLASSGVWRRLRRLGLQDKRGRRSVPSPDSAYDRKLTRIHAACALARWRPERYVVLYEDELTDHLRPTVAQDYASVGADAPRAQQGWAKKRAWRIAGSLNPLTGQHHAQQAARFDRRTLLAYRQGLEAAYHAVRRLFGIVDNWPVPFHADLLAGLADSRLRLLLLPTYAPWTNPREKVWRKLYAELLHHHEGAFRWADFRQDLQARLDHLNEDRHGVLRYVGLCPPSFGKHHQPGDEWPSALPAACRSGRMGCYGRATDGHGAQDL
jgi:hypothetical protein